jgi:hypothetical protein
MPVDAGAIEAAIRHRWDEWMEAVENRDRSLVDPDFKGRHEMKEFSVVPINDACAVAYGSYFGEAKYRDGRQFGGTIRFSTVWALDADDTWRCGFYHGAFADDVVMS